MKTVFLLITSVISLFNASYANTFHTEKWVTPNGVHVVFYPAMEVPMLDITLAFAAGSAYDGDSYGLSAFTAKMLQEGSAGKNATTLAESLADAGAQFDVDTNRDMTILNLRTLTKPQNLAQATTTFTQIVQKPDFPAQGFTTEKKQILMAIKQRGESPEDIAALRFFDELYHQHPYAHSVQGTAKTVSALTRNQLHQFYKRYYVANNAYLIMVGAIDSPKAHQLAEQITQGLSKGTAAGPIAKALQLNAEATINIPFPSTQTVVQLGQVGIDYQDANYFPLMVGNYILGGGNLVSRLGLEVREKRGLTYGVSSQFVPMPGQGPFLISLSTKNNQANNALEVTKTTLTHFIETGPEEEELEAAKHYLIGSFPMALASNRSIASLLLHMSFYHLPEDYLETYSARVKAVTRQQIQQAFQKQVNPNKLLLVTVGQS